MKNVFPSTEGDKVKDRALAFVRMADELFAGPGNTMPDDPKTRDLLLEVAGCRRAAANIAKVATRPMTVAFFGPSQSGKSYLVNELVRGKNSSLEVVIGSGRKVDFLNAINPPGGRESTAQVTRFTRFDTPPPKEGYDIHVRLLSATDLVKIFANGYAHECRHTLKPDLSKVGDNAGPHDKKTHEAPLLSSLEIAEIHEYLTKEVQAPYFQRLNDDGYWRIFQDRIAFTSAKTQLKYLSLLWGAIDSLTRLFGRLFNNIRTLNCEDIWVSESCLIPREESIIDVQYLKQHLREGGDEKIDFITPNGFGGRMPKSRLAALTAELVLRVPDRDDDEILAFADVLDFPGARARGNNFSTRQLNESETGCTAGNKILDYVCEVFLRGKLGYLFDRYVELRDMNSLVLCCPPGDNEALSMPHLVDKWIATTHGTTPTERHGTPPTLYVVFTKFDATLVQAEGEPADSQVRWDSRLKTGFRDFFAKADADWTTRWDRQGAFHNCYWVRNPRVKSAVFQSVPGQGEDYTGVYREWVAQLTEYYLANSHVNDHFLNPRQSWEAVTRPGNNGIDLLLANLGRDLSPARKSNMLQFQLDRMSGQVRQAMAPYLANLSGAEAAVNQARERILEMGKSQRERLSFGLVLYRLSLDELAVVSIFEQVCRGTPLEESDDFPGLAGRPVEPKPEDSFASLDDNDIVWGDEEASKPIRRKKPDKAAPDGHPAAHLEELGDRAVRFSGSVMEEWESRLHGTIGDSAFHRETGLSGEWFASVTEQLILSARNRHDLRTTIARHSAKAFASPRPMEHAREQAVTASCIINRFVNNLGEQPLALPELRNGNPKATGLVFPGQRFFEAWTQRLEAIYIENAGLTTEVTRAVEATKDLAALYGKYRELLG